MKVDGEEEEEEAGPVKGSGGYGVRKGAQAQKDRAEKWAKENYKPKNQNNAAAASGASSSPPAKAKSALDVAREDAKRIQKDKLDARVSKLKVKK